MSTPIRTLSIALLLFILWATTVQAAPTMVAMRDGVHLATDCFVPDSGGPQFSTVLIRSLYGRKHGPALAEQYNPLGIAVVIQDTRGRGGSEGKDMVFADDGWGGRQDGADTMDWIIDQPWSNGRVGGLGGSALGIAQVLLAASTDDLACQSIMVACSDFYGQLAYQGGVFRKALAETWLTKIDSPHMIDVWHSHPTDDIFWQGLDAEQRAPYITTPGLHIGGWFDIFAQGTLNNFVSRETHGGKGARGNQVLVIGPWPHGPMKKVGDLEFPDNFNFDFPELEKRFIRYWLLDEANGVMDEPPVHYYTMGACGEDGAPGNEWRTAESWPPFETTSTPFYLDEGNRLAGTRPDEPGSAKFAYDPTDPCPTHGGQNLAIPAGPFDQREVSGRSDVLKFETAPLESPLEITGAVRAELYVSTDAPDTDFTAKLVDVYPDGREILILDNIRRLKFHRSFKQADPVPPGDVVRLDIELWSTSLIVNTGHKLAIHISSSNYPRFEKNPNTGDDLPQDGQTRVAHNTVYFGEKFPSALVVPVRSAAGTVDSGL